MSVSVVSTDSRRPARLSHPRGAGFRCSGVYSRTTAPREAAPFLRDETVLLPALHHLPFLGPTRAPRPTGLTAGAFGGPRAQALSPSCVLQTGTGCSADACGPRGRAGRSAPGARRRRKGAPPLPRRGGRLRGPELGRGGTGGTQDERSLRASESLSCLRQCCAWGSQTRLLLKHLRGVSYVFSETSA